MHYNIVKILCLSCIAIALSGCFGRPFGAVRRVWTEEVTVDEQSIQTWDGTCLEISSHGNRNQRLDIIVKLPDKPTAVEGTHDWVQPIGGLRRYQWTMQQDWSRPDKSAVTDLPQVITKATLRTDSGILALISFDGSTMEAPGRFEPRGESPPTGLPWAENIPAQVIDHQGKKVVREQFISQPRGMWVGEVIVTAIGLPFDILFLPLDLAGIGPGK